MLAGQVFILSFIIYFNQFNPILSQKQSGCAAYYKFKPLTTSTTSSTKLSPNNNTNGDDSQYSTYTSTSSWTTTSSVDDLSTGQDLVSTSKTTVSHSKRHTRREILDLEQAQDPVQGTETELGTLNEDDIKSNVLLAKGGFGKVSKHTKSKASPAKGLSGLKEDKNPTTKADPELSDGLHGKHSPPTGDITDGSSSGSSGKNNSTDSYVSPSKGDDHTTDSESEKEKPKKGSGPPKFSPPTGKSEGLHGIKKDVQPKPSIPKSNEGPSKIDPIESDKTDSSLDPIEKVTAAPGLASGKSDKSKLDPTLHPALESNLEPSPIKKGTPTGLDTGSKPKDHKTHQSAHSADQPFKTSGYVEMIPSGSGVCGPVSTENVLGVCLWSGSDSTGSDPSKSGWLTSGLNSNCGKEVLVYRSDDPTVKITAKVVDACGFNKLKAETGCSEIYLTKMAFLAMKPNESESKTGHLNNLVWKL
ncbi:hypothetical protein DFH28DRAFT_904553 [Melampsora americana]|nr:hypothetical protein DFH28DRAFT_904553 [Melampsora americana]